MKWLTVLFGLMGLYSFNAFGNESCYNSYLYSWDKIHPMMKEAYPWRNVDSMEGPMMLSGYIMAVENYALCKVESQIYCQYIQNHRKGTRDALELAFKNIKTIGNVGELKRLRRELSKNECKKETRDALIDELENLRVPLKRLKNELNYTVHGTTLDLSEQLQLNSEMPDQNLDRGNNNVVLEEERDNNSIIGNNIRSGGGCILPISTGLRCNPLHPIN